MSSKTIFLCIGLFATLSLSAQQFSLGIKGGYSISNIAYSGRSGSFFSREHSPIAGFHAGIAGRWELGDRLALTTELQYAQKGYTSVLSWPTGIAKAYYTLHYGTLPVVGSFRFWKGLAVQGGVEAGWLLKARGKSAGESFDLQQLDLYNDFDFGILTGLEYQFGKAFFLSARYTFGIITNTDVEFTDDNGQSLSDVHPYNTSTQFSAGYRYYFGK